MKKVLLVCFLLISIYTYTQVLPADRSVDWSLAGYRGAIPDYPTVVSITNYGGSGDGVSINDSAFTGAVNSLSGADGVIYFPSGTYLFNSPITLRSGLVIRGSGADSTTIKLNLGGTNSSDAITIFGSASNTTALLISNGEKDSSFIYADSTWTFASGDYVQLSLNDSSLLYSPWAYGSVGQIVKIATVNANKLLLESPLRMSYNLTKNPMITKLNMITGVGIECVRIERMDQTTAQTSNIAYSYTAQCWVSGVESSQCNFAHIEINNSTNLSITGSYFHDAFAYGGGGQGYGIACQTTSGECLIENNIFDHLRHSMLLQSGANDNVFGYNYSINPYWSEQSLPSNSAGDMVLHGNYPYANLFEGNIGQNIVIDDSHGENGPYNTFFRNRGELYGIFMNNNPASDNQNFIGNEVTNNGFGLGFYLINGTGHFQYGNNVKGTIYASGTATLSDTSYYYKTRPDFLQTLTTWPSVGIPNLINSGAIPAKNRYQASNYTVCDGILPTDITTITNEKQLQVFPNPSNGILYINVQGPIDIAIYNSMGCIVAKYPAIKDSSPVDLSGFPKGIYTLKAEAKIKTYLPVRIVIQ